MLNYPWFQLLGLPGARVFCGSQNEADVDSLNMLIKIYEDRRFNTEKIKQMGDDLHLCVKDALKG